MSDKNELNSVSLVFFSFSDFLSLNPSSDSRPAVAAEATMIHISSLSVIPAAKKELSLVTDCDEREKE